MIINASEGFTNRKGRTEDSTAQRVWTEMPGTERRFHRKQKCGTKTDSDHLLNMERNPMRSHPALLPDNGSNPAHRVRCINDDRVAFLQTCCSGGKEKKGGGSLG